MSKRNYDFVTAEVDSGLSYYVMVCPEARTPGEWRREALSVLSSALESFEDLLTVTRAELSLQPVRDQNGEPLLSQFDVRESETIELQDDTGLDSRQLQDAVTDAVVEAPAESTVVPVKFEMIDGWVDMYLSQGFLSIGSHCEFYKKRDRHRVIDERPSAPPLTLTFNHGRNRRTTDSIKRYYDSPRDQCAVVYDLRLRSKTDIWFFEKGDKELVAPLARINRARFNEAFQRFAASEDLLETFWVSVDFPGDSSRFPQLLNYEGPPADVLLTQYRRDWVESQLLDHAAGDTVDGQRVVSFGPVEQHVFPDELKLRTETYLFESGDHEVVDRVRVTTADGETLVGTVGEETIHWGGQS